MDHLNEEIRRYNLDPRIKMLQESTINRDPRIRARDNESHRLKSENARMKSDIGQQQKRISFLEAELKRVRQERNMPIKRDILGEESEQNMRAEMLENKLLLEQNAKSEMVINATVMENNIMKGRIRELIKANRSLHMQIRAVEYKLRCAQQPNTCGTNNSLNDVTSSAVRYAVEEYRRNFDYRERELESKLSQWQEKADRAAAEIISLREQVQTLNEENARLRFNQSDSCIAITTKQEPCETYLPFKKRFKN